MKEENTINRKNTSRSIDEELKELADALSSVVKEMRQAHLPLQESSGKVPQAAEQLEKVSQQTEDAAHKVLDMVEAITEREGEIEVQIKQLRRILPSTYFRNNSRVKRIVEQINENARTNRNDAFQIMDALQFQDITSQQVDHALSLLEQVETRIHDALARFTGQEVTESKVKVRNRAFDKNAHFSTESGGQGKVDELLKNLQPTESDR